MRAIAVTVVVRSAGITGDADESVSRDTAAGTNSLASKHGIADPRGEG